MDIYDTIAKGLESVYEQNGTGCEFDGDLFYLTEGIEEHLRRYGYAKIDTILRGLIMVGMSDEQDEIDKEARKYSKNEIFDVINKVAFLAGAIWAKCKTAGDYKPPKNPTHCPLCGAEY